MSSTIVRVKRRLEETPADALVLHCKRPKTEKEEHLAPSVFVFSGTVEEKDHSQVSHIKKSWLKNHDKTHMLDTALNIQDLLKKLKAEHDLQVQKQRIQVVNCSRGIKLSSEDGSGDTCAETSEDHCTVLDLHHSNEGGPDKEPTVASTSAQYAYDLYLSHQNDFDAKTLDHIIRIDPYHGDLVFGTFRENGRASSDEDANPEDEDSNDENNWRNEYPDTDESVNEEDMRRAMNNCSIDEALSSDEYDEDLVYGSGSSKCNFPGVKKEDVERYGLAYARYKAKLARGKQLVVDGEPSLINVEDDDDEYRSPANSRSDDDSQSSSSDKENDYRCNDSDDYDND